MFSMPISSMPIDDFRRLHYHFDFRCRLRHFLDTSHQRLFTLFSPAAAMRAAEICATMPRLRCYFFFRFSVRFRAISPVIVA